MKPDESNPRESANGSQTPAKSWLLAALVSLIVLLSSLAQVDRLAEAEYKALFQRALITFALARTLNGVISAVQGTELALQPAGVGVTLTPGEVLDPINDLVERFSWIMLGATLSLGVQQVLLDVGQWWGIKVLVAALGLLWLWIRLRQSFPRSGQVTSEKLLFRLFILAVFLRFAVPAVMLANEGMYRLFLESRYEESTQIIESAGSDLREVSDSNTEVAIEETEEGVFDSLSRMFDDTRNTLNIRDKMAKVSERASDLVEHLIQLGVVFILQTGLLPIAFLWIFLQLFKGLFRLKN